MYCRRSSEKTVRPRARRELAEWAQQVHRLSQRRVAQLIPIERMTLRYEHHRDPQEALRIRLRELAGSRVRYGYRGRVDVIGNAGRTPILLINAAVKGASDMFHVSVSIEGKMPPPPTKCEEPIIWEWKVRDPQSRTSYMTFDQKALFAILLEVGKS